MCLYIKSSVLFMWLFLIVFVLHERLWLVTCWHKELSFFCADQLALSYNWKRHIIYLLTSRYLNAKIVFFILQLQTLCMNKEQCYYDSTYSDADPMIQFEFSHLCKTNTVKPLQSFHIWNSLYLNKLHIAYNMYAL